MAYTVEQIRKMRQSKGIDSNGSKSTSTVKKQVTVDDVRKMREKLKITQTTKNFPIPSSDRPMSTNTTQGEGIVPQPQKPKPNILTQQDKIKQHNAYIKDTKNGFYTASESYPGSTPQYTPDKQAVYEYLAELVNQGEDDAVLEALALQYGIPYTYE